MGSGDYEHCRCLLCVWMERKRLNNSVIKVSVLWVRRYAISWMWSFICVFWYFQWFPADTKNLPLRSLEIFLELGKSKILSHMELALTCLIVCFRKQQHIHYLWYYNCYYYYAIRIFDLSLDKLLFKWANSSEILTFHWSLQNLIKNQ